jgi:hypothetical protein
VTFKEISAWISSAVVVVLYGYYLTQAPHATTRLEALKLYVGVAVLMIIAQIVLHAIAALLHRPEKADERDRLIAAKSARNGAFVLMFGCVLATYQLLIPLPFIAEATRLPQSMLAVHVLVLTTALSELTRFTSQLVFYRRGA